MFCRFKNKGRHHQVGIPVEKVIVRRRSFEQPMGSNRSPLRSHVSARNI